MYDDGTHEDSVAGDGTFTASTQISASAGDDIVIRVSAGLRRALLRVMSGPVRIPVWSSLQTTNYSVLLPATWHSTTEPDGVVTVDTALRDAVGEPRVNVSIVSVNAGQISSVDEFLEMSPDYFSEAEVTAEIADGALIGIHESMIARTADGHVALIQTIGGEGGWATRAFIYADRNIVIGELSSESDNFNDEAVKRLRTEFAEIIGSFRSR